MTRRSQTPADVVLEEVHRWLELGDDLLPSVILTSVVANWLSGEQPVWTMIVAPPSSGKTALIEAVEEIHGVQALGKLTARTFVSGLAGDDYSLLTRMNQDRKWLMTHKDWGTVMSLNPNERNEVLSQLRQIYDGKFDATYGTAVSISWRGKLGFIVGATPTVDRLQKWSTELGERFVQFRPTAPDKHRVTIQAALNKGHEKQMRKSLAGAFIRAFVHAKNIAKTQPSHSPEGDLVAGALATLVATARTSVHRDRYTGGFEVAEPEGPARLAGVFTQLYRAASLCFGGDHEAATALVVRIAIDSITSPGQNSCPPLRIISARSGSPESNLKRRVGAFLGRSWR